MIFEVKFDGEIRNVVDGRLDPDAIPAPHDIKQFLTETMSYLATSSDVLRSDYSANPSKGEIDIIVSVEAEDELRSIELGSAIIRSAIHAAGGHTPGWKVEWCVSSRDEQRVLTEAG